MNISAVSKLVSLVLVTSILPLSAVGASNSATFQTVQPTWLTPAFAGDFEGEYKLFTDSNQRVLISQFAGSNHLTKSMLTIVSNGTLTPVEALKYPRNYNGSIVGQIAPELFIVDEFFNGAPADDPDRTKMSNWQYPSHQRYFVKNLAGENVFAGLDKNLIQKLLKTTNNRLLTTKVIKGDSPQPIGEKPQYIHNFQLLNSTNFSEPIQIWESQIFESERDPDWDPFVFANDSVLLGVEVLPRTANTRCSKLVSLNSSGQLDTSWPESINNLIKLNPKTKDLSLINFNTKPLKLSRDRLAFKLTLGSTQSLCRNIDTQAFLITDNKAGIISLSVPNYKIFENWKKRDAIWIECITLDRCLNIDVDGKVYWTDQNLQEVSNSTYYQLIPSNDLPISGTSTRYDANPNTGSPVNSTVKDWRAAQVLKSSNQIVGLMIGRANVQNDPNLATQWNSNFVAGFLIPETPKVIKAINSITCVKGKTTKKVSGVNQKCPKGFKKV
jgi:hypothetical protein